MKLRTRVIAVIAFLLSVVFAGAVPASATTAPPVEISAPAANGLPPYLAV
ncbi:MAG: hypothetical protein QOI78_1582, partial [Actinomycetota bacterium]|nr:hypothetical protein [Actinomycetota bacterium]